MGQSDLALQLKGFALTTAEEISIGSRTIHPSFKAMSGRLDQSPLFPRLKGFLVLWSRNLEGRLYRVTVAHKALIQPHELKFTGNGSHLH